MRGERNSAIRDKVGRWSFLTRSNELTHMMDEEQKAPEGDAAAPAEMPATDAPAEETKEEEAA